VAGTQGASYSSQSCLKVTWKLATSRSTDSSTAMGKPALVLTAGYGLRYALLRMLLEKQASYEHT